MYSLSIEVLLYCMCNITREDGKEELFLVDKTRYMYAI